MDDTSSNEKKGTPIDLGFPTTVLADGIDGLNMKTRGVGANPQEPAVVLSSTRNAADVLAMEQLRGR
jgi:hypothetical protein